jgi:hypothetical protein
MSLAIPGSLGRFSRIPNPGRDQRKLSFLERPQPYLIRPAVVLAERGGLWRSTAAIRSAAWPSPNSGGRGPRGRKDRHASTMRRGSVPTQEVPSHFHGLHQLGLLPQGEAGDAEEIRLPLDPAGVREDHPGVGLQGEHVQVAHRLDQTDMIRCLQAIALQGLTGSGMNREQDGLRDGVQGGEDPGETVRGVGVPARWTGPASIRRAKGSSCSSRTGARSSARGR